MSGSSTPRTIAPLVVIALLVLMPIAGVVYALAVPPEQLYTDLIVGPGVDAPPPLIPVAGDIGEVITDGRVGELLLRSLVLGAAVAIGALVLGTWLAWLEQRCRYPGRPVLAVASLLPMAMPSYVIAAALRDEFSPGGWSGQWLGLPPFSGLGPAILTLIVVCTPLVQVVVGAALARSSAAEEEAARSLGAGGWRRLRTVWLSRLRPAWAMSLLLVALYAVSDFGAVAVLDCPVLTWRMYQAADHQLYAEVAVLAAAVLIATVPLVVGARLLRGRLPRLATVANPRPAARRALRGWWRLGLAYLAHALVVGLGLAVPVLVLTGWVATGKASDPDSLLQAIPDSLQLAGFGTALTLLIALWAAWQATRGRHRSGGTIEHTVYLTGALPGVLLAAGLIFAALGISRGLGDDQAGRLYHWLGASGTLLMLGYAIRFLPEGFAPLRNAVAAIDPRHSECARSLGVGRLGRACRLHLPALAPGSAAAAVLVGVAILKELPVTMILGAPTGQRALSHYVYDRYTDAFLADAGLAGLLLVGIALVAVVVSLRFRRHV